MDRILILVLLAMVSAHESSYDSLVASQCKSRCLSLYPWRHPHGSERRHRSAAVPVVYLPPRSVSSFSRPLGLKLSVSRSLIKTANYKLLHKYWPNDVVIFLRNPLTTPASANVSRPTTPICTATTTGRITLNGTRSWRCAPRTPTVFRYIIESGG